MLQYLSINERPSLSEKELSSSSLESVGNIGLRSNRGTTYIKGSGVTLITGSISSSINIFQLGSKGSTGTGRRGHIVLKYRRDECMQRNQTRETLGNVERILSIKRNRKKVNGSTGIGKGDKE